MRRDDLFSAASGNYTLSFVLSFHTAWAPRARVTGKVNLWQLNNFPIFFTARMHSDNLLLDILAPGCCLFQSGWIQRFSHFTPHQILSNYLHSQSICHLILNSLGCSCCFLVGGNATDTNRVVWHQCISGNWIIFFIFLFLPKLLKKKKNP